MEIRTIKLTNGEEFIAEVVTEDNNNGLYHFVHPVVLINQPDGSVAFTPWISTTKETNYRVPSSLVLFILETTPELNAGYEQLFGKKSDIIVPSNHGIILG